MWALWSINERVGDREGAELPKPDSFWIGDLIAALRMDREENDRLAEEIERRSRG